MFDPRSPHAHKAVFPEFPTCTDKSQWLAHYLVLWLTDADSYEERLERLRRIKSHVAHGGASRTAAGYILDQLRPRRFDVPRPHFLPGHRFESTQGRFAMADASIHFFGSWRYCWDLETQNQ